MAKVLLHTLVFSPDSVSTSYLMTDLARELSRMGHQVKVLTTTPHYNLDPGTLSRQPLQPVWPGLLAKSRLGRIPVWHVKMPQKGQRVAGRMLDYVRFHLVSLAAGAAAIGKYDIVIAPSPPLTIGVVAWLLGVLRRAPSVYNVQEIYPDFAINQGLMNNSALVQLMRWIEKFVYARSAKVVPISEWFSRIIAARGVPRGKLLVIPNFVDAELYQPLPRANPFSQQHGLLEQFVVLYGGNIGLSQDWESLLFAAAELSHLPIQFVVVGDGARREWLEGEVAARGLKNVRLLGYQPREMMPLANASSDIGTIPMKANTTTDTFPSKIYTIMACAKPAVVSAEADTELAWIIRESGCGRVVPPDDPRAYSDAVLKAFHDKDTLVAEGERGRKFIETRYSKQAIARQYDALIRQLVRGK